jgi:hypothetical protein
MPTLDLSAEAAAVGLDLNGEELDALSPSEREAICQTWQGRMLNEHVSARVFAALLGQMMAAGSPAARLAAVAGMISEELTHGRLCAAVVHALGGDPVLTYGDLDAPATHPDATPLEALLRNVLSISCLSETVAVALIGAEKLRAGPPALQEILADILADEVQHARLGWSLLEDHRADLDPALCARLGDYLATAFCHLRVHELAHLPETSSPSALAESYGVCDGSDARALFFDTVHEVIIPRLEEFGIPAERAWEASFVLERRVAG